MKIVATSDWHGTLPENLPEGDVLAIAGDLLPVWNHDRAFQEEWVCFELIPYLARLRSQFRKILFVAGNHDFLFAETPEFREWLPENVHYLEDESITIDGLKFHGTPWSTFLPRWAFMLPEDQLAEKWALIPDDTHVLIVHGPPQGVRDFTIPRYGSKHVGSLTLRNRILNLNLQLVITGHIHEGYGCDWLENTRVENVSLMDENYNPVNAPKVLLNLSG